MHECVVYWLKDKTCTDPEKHGYIGITKRLPRRVTEHRRKFGADFDVEVLFRGTRDECLAEEKRLRPWFDIGWNLISGGLTRRYPPSSKEKIGNGNRGKVRSQAFRDNLSAKLTGRKHTPERAAKTARAQRGKKRPPHVVAILLKNFEVGRHDPSVQARRIESIRRRYAGMSDEERAKFGEPGRRPKSAEHRAKIGAANSRRIISEETRARQSAAKRGRSPSAESRAKMSAAHTKRWQELKGETDGNC